MSELVTWNTSVQKLKIRKKKKSVENEKPVNKQYRKYFQDNT